MGNGKCSLLCSNIKQVATKILSLVNKKMKAENVKAQHTISTIFESVYLTLSVEISSVHGALRQVFLEKCVDTLNSSLDEAC